MKKPAALRSYALAVASLMSAVAAHAQILFQDNFDTTPSTAWNVNAGSANDRATFLFDYSLLGIPSAPNSSGTTTGVRLQANRSPGAAATGVSISPIGQSFTGDYQLRFDAWHNFNGTFPAGGSGSTQLTGGGILSSGTTPTFHTATGGSGLWFAATGDGGATQDYRAYFNGTHQLLTVGAPTTYAAGSQNSSATYYSVYTGKTAPAPQTTAFPQQTGTTAVGSQAFSWHDVAITKSGNLVTYEIDGTLIATVDLSAAATAGTTFSGGNILLAHSDINTTSSTDPNADSLLFGLVDNVRVTLVPEPSTYALMSLGALALLARARRSTKR